MGFICQKGKIRFLSELNKFFLPIVIRAQVQRSVKGVVSARRQIQTVNNVLNVDLFSKIEFSAANVSPMFTYPA